MCLFSPLLSSTPKEPDLRLDVQVQGQRNRINRRKALNERCLV